MMKGKSILKPGVITVIVPIYNIEDYLEPCIDSIINQTYHKLEILLVNDGSSDNSLQICREYEARDERIRVIDKDNGGLSEARNYGIDAALGEYLFFLDGDDYIHPKACEILLDNLLSNQAEISIGNYEKVADVKQTFDHDMVSETRVYTGRESCLNIYSNLGVVFTIACGKLYRAELFQHVRYPVGKLHEDEFVTYRLLYHSKVVVYTDRILYYYVKRESSIMNQVYDQKNLTMLEMSRQAINFYKQKEDTELKKLAIERAFGLCRMLYDKYVLSKNKECQKVVLTEYRFLCKEYGDIFSWFARTEIWIYGRTPKGSFYFQSLLCGIRSMKSRLINIVK